MPSSLRPLSVFLPFLLPDGGQQPRPTVPANRAAHTSPPARRRLASQLLLLPLILLSFSLDPPSTPSVGSPFSLADLRSLPLMVGATRPAAVPYWRHLPSALSPISFASDNQSFPLLLSPSSQLYSQLWQRSRTAGQLWLPPSKPLRARSTSPPSAGCLHSPLISHHWIRTSIPPS